MTPVEKVLTDIRAIAKDEHDKGSHPKEEAGAVGDRDHAVRHLIGLARLSGTSSAWPAPTPSTPSPPETQGAETT